MNNERAIMKGLRVVKYYKKILTKYTMEQAMKDSLCFKNNSEEQKALIIIAEDKKYTIHTLLDKRELLSFHETSHFDYLLFIKMLADVLNNIETIKNYLNRHSKSLKNHRKMLVPGIVNMDFLREGNFIKINGNYYNLEIAAYIMTAKNYQALYNHFITATFYINNSSEEGYRESIFYTLLQRISEDIPMYTDLSITKQNDEIISLMCMNTQHNDIITKLCLNWNPNYGKGFKYYFPMTHLYKDNLWITREMINIENILSVSREKQIQQLLHKFNVLEKVRYAEFNCTDTSVYELISVNIMYMQNLRL